MTSRHPEFSAEQRYVHRAHDGHASAIARSRAVVDGTGPNAGADAKAAAALREEHIARLDALLGVQTSKLVTGRLDLKDESRDAVYLGPTTVFDETGARVVVIGFTHKKYGPAFYRATEEQPMGLVRRRTFDADGRTLIEIEDEVFGTLPPRLRKSADQPVRSRRTVLDRVAEELERAREPHMRDIVATIVADQYRMIEAPKEGVFVVQGGPGTGKTAVALHRAVYLIRNHDDLGRVLVVGPNQAFMSFISKVLPGLGERTVDQIAIDRLAATVEIQVRSVDPPGVRVLKGDTRMAKVLRRGLRQRITAGAQEISVRWEGSTVSAGREQCGELAQRELDAGRPYMDARARFRAAMREAVISAFSSRFRGTNFPRQSLERHLANSREWINQLERAWPTASAPQLLHDLLTVEQRLAAAADGILSEREVRQLLRPAVRNVGGHPWSAGDMPMLDEALSLLTGTPSRRYGYVIVDEAQDLTPMELRMIARRSPTGNLTLVGDIAQATGPHRYTSWDEIVAHLPVEGEIRRDELTVGYRVPRSMMELANLVLPIVAPDLAPTEPVREAREVPRFEQVDADDLYELAAAAVAEMSDPDRTVGVIVPEALLTGIRGALAAGGVIVGDIETDQLDKQVTLLSSKAAKGLEFDRVVLVEPRSIVTGSEAGWSELYVALTRATQELVIVHAEPLPAPLPGGTDVVDRDIGADTPAEAAIVPAVSPAREAETSAEPPEPAEAETSAEPPEPAEAETPAGEVPHVVLDTEEGDVVADPETPGVELTASNGTTRSPAVPGTTMQLGGSFSEALLVAKLTHDGQTRRGTAVPYLGHLLGTAALVLEDGGTETEVVAALLHDAVEDGGGLPVLQSIERRFGSEVAAIVQSCTDPVGSGRGFRDIKQEHLAVLERGSAQVRRVALAEKLDNARALRRDLERFGDETWTRMAVRTEDLLWYYGALVRVFRRSFPSPLAAELESVVEEITRLAGVEL